MTPPDKPMPYNTTTKASATIASTIKLADEGNIKTFRICDSVLKYLSEQSFTSFFALQ